MTIRLLRFASLPSTSTHAAQLIAAGEPLPFAVTATEQTAGRGQRGRSWLGCQGNLYLSLALPQATNGDPALMPLQAAVVVAQWLQAYCGVRITLKWPNDLYLAGRKIGGILCESSVSADEWGPLLVGIGLNTAEAPQLTEGTYQAAALAALSLRPLGDTDGMAAALCAFWPQAWERVRRASLPAAFAAFAIGPGQLWRDKDGAFFREQALAADGSLPLAACARGQSDARLSSASNDFSWMYQARMALPLLVADIGNSRAKIALFADRHDPEPKAVWSLDLGRDQGGGEVAAPAAEKLAKPAAPPALVLPAIAEALSQSLRAHNILRPEGKAPLAQPPWPLFTASVNDRARDHLAQLCQGYGLRLEPLPKRRVLSWGQTYDEQQLGADRLALIEAYLASQLAAEPQPQATLALLVSAGTATTCDLVLANGEHLGGYIVPGLQISLDALAEKTERLPALTITGQNPTGLGHNTAEAMQKGVLAMSLGLLERLHRYGTKELNHQHIRVILTGGNAPLLCRELAHLGAEHDPHLILKGVRVMALGGSSHKA